MPFEVAQGCVAERVAQRALCLRYPMALPIFGRLIGRLLTLGPLAYGSEIYQIAHFWPRRVIG